MRSPTQSFEEFFDEHFDAVRRSLAVAFMDPVLAEDCAQDAFTRALAQWRRVSQMERPAGWVYVTALRGGRRVRSREWRAAAMEVAGAGSEGDTLENRLDLEAAIEALPPRQRLAVVLRYLADLSLVEVAEAMGCATGTAKSTLHAALERLGRSLHEEVEYADE